MTTSDTNGGKNITRCYETCNNHRLVTWIQDEIRSRSTNKRDTPRGKRDTNTYLSVLQFVFYP